MKVIEVKTAELVGVALDWAVAKAEGDDHWTSDRNPDWFAWRMRNWKPSTDWAQGGPLIEKYKVSHHYDRLHEGKLTCQAFCAGFPFPSFGETPIIAACRVIAASKLGDTISIPAELLTSS